MPHWGLAKGERLLDFFFKRNSQGEDPRTFDGNSQGGDLSTPKTHSQGEDPRTFTEPVERWRVQKKRKEKKWKKKKKKDKKKKVKYRRRSWWKKCKERIASFFTAKRKEEKKERQKETSQSETSLGDIWKMALFPCAVGAESDLCKCCNRRLAEKDGDDGKVAAVGKSSKKEWMDGGVPTRAETVERKRQD